MCGKMAVVLGQSAPPAIETGSKIKVRCASVRFPVIDHAKSFRLSLILRLRLCTYLLCRQFVFPCIPALVDFLFTNASSVFIPLFDSLTAQSLAACFGSVSYATPFLSFVLLYSLALTSLLPRHP